MRAQQQSFQRILGLVRTHHAHHKRDTALSVIEAVHRHPGDPRTRTCRGIEALCGVGRTTCSRLITEFRAFGADSALAQAAAFYGYLISVKARGETHHYLMVEPNRVEPYWANSGMYEQRDIRSDICGEVSPSSDLADYLDGLTIEQDGGDPYIRWVRKC